MTRTSAGSEQPTEASFTRSLDRSRFVPGTVLDKRYRIVGLLGRGGMGEVFRADDMKLGQPVALKFLPEGLEGDEQRLSRFLNEVRTARQVTHPNVCRVFDIGEMEGQHYLSMEYVDGEDLSSLLRRIGRLPKNKATQIARQLCVGVQAAHEQGILHRDLKPANVMIDGRGQVKITDFGLAGLEQTIQDGEIRSGTPAYMAPEQFAGREVTVRSDIYALGLVLYELFTGKPAFETSSPMEIARLHSDATPSSPSSHVEGFDPAVERIILRCLEKDPHDRPASALAVSAALPGGDALAAALAAGETPSPEMVAAAGTTGAMHPALALGLALLAVVGWAGAQYAAGTLMSRFTMALEKPPAALTADAHEVIRKLGYTEPLYAKPVDSAVGYHSHLERLGEDGTSPEFSDAPSDPRLGSMSFWYRQRPSPLVPRRGWLDPPATNVEARRLMVEIANPPVDTPGEIVVGLDLKGRLESFVARPKRISAERPGDDDGDDLAPDWSIPFALAGLDMDRLAPVDPAYDALVSADLRTAWVGMLPRGKVRIEAAATAGRIVSFTVLGETEVRRLASEPEPSPSSAGLGLFMVAFALIFTIPAVLFARRNFRTGRADRRGAARITLFTFVGTCVSLALASHRFWSRDTWWEWNPMIGQGFFWAGVTWIVYVALEPYARRVWPSILTSWSLLVSRPNVRLREPQIGRAVLAGLLCGSALALLRPLSFLLSDPTGAPQYDSAKMLLVLGQRYLLAEVVGVATAAIGMSISAAFLLVLGRSLFRSRFAAVLFLGFLLFGSSVLSWPEPAATVVAASVVWSAIMVTLLVRFGLLAYTIGWIFNVHLSWVSATTSWTAWHGQPGLIMLLIVGLVAAYGFWAATVGRPLFGDALAAVAPKT